MADTLQEIFQSLNRNELKDLDSFLFAVVSNGHHKWVSEGNPPDKDFWRKKASKYQNVCPFSREIWTGISG